MHMSIAAHRGQRHVTRVYEPTQHGCREHNSGLLQVCTQLQPLSCSFLVDMYHYPCMLHT